MFIRLILLLLRIRQHSVRCTDEDLQTLGMRVQGRLGCWRFDLEAFLFSACCGRSFDR